MMAVRMRGHALQVNPESVDLLTGVQRSSNSNGKHLWGLDVCRANISKEPMARATSTLEDATLGQSRATRL